MKKNRVASSFILHPSERRTAMARHTCPHVAQIRPVTPRTVGCEECLAAGDAWVHLRLCLTCGHVGCCDSSQNKHATQHFHATGHPVMKSAEPGEDWGWCYVDQVQLDSV
jgi:monovalent cation:H+ antiporter-2, CPA2 family